LTDQSVDERDEWLTAISATRFNAAWVDAIAGRP